MEVADNVSQLLSCQAVLAQLWLGENDVFIRLAIFLSDV